MYIYIQSKNEFDMKIVGNKQFSMSPTKWVGVCGYVALAIGSSRSLKYSCLIASSEEIRVLG